MNNQIQITSSMLTKESGEGDVNKLIGSNGFWFAGWDNYPASAYIDLGKKYLIDTIQFNDVEGEGDYEIYVGQPNEWLLLWEGTTDKREVYEKKTLAHTQYIRIVLLEAGANINSFKVFGSIVTQNEISHKLVIKDNGNEVANIKISKNVNISFVKSDTPPDNGGGNPDPEPDPEPPIVVPPDANGFTRTLDRHVGTNVLADDPANLVAPVAGNVRIYQYLKWLNNDVSNTDTNKPLSQVKINFNPNDAWGFNHDQSTKSFSELGEAYITLFESSMYQTDNDKTWLNAVAYRRRDGRSGLDQPHRWKYLSHLFFQVAARYGNTQVDPSKLITDSQKISGLGYCKYIEGPNEADRWWIGYDKADLSPEEHAALYSAVYDGHMNTMKEDGVYFGVKNADPSMKLMLGGLAFVDFDELLRTGKVDWFERFFAWFENNRKDPNYETYPIDVICYHDYPNTERKQRNLSGKGLDPETYKWYEKTKKFVEYIQTRCPKPLEVDNNEFWYDRSQSSPQRAEPYAGFNSEEVAGMWGIRCILEGWAAGLTRGVQFYFRDNQSNGGGIFQSSGLTNKSNGYSPFQSYHYMATLRHAGKNLDFVSRQVIGDMVKLTCVNKSTGKKAHILWFFSKQNKKQNYQLSVTSNSVEEIRIVNGSNTGQSSNKNASGGKVQVLVSEMPTFILEK